MHRAISNLKRSPFQRRLYVPEAVRWQHNGQHTWYFQEPNSVPDPPTDSEISTSTQKPPLTWRSQFRRSLFWAATFMTMGWAVQESWKMIKLLSKSEFKDAKATEAYLKLTQKLFTVDPLVKTIEADPDWLSIQKGPNQEPYPFIQHGDQFMSSKPMTGAGGVISKCYFNQQRGIIIFMVRFGRGMEWVPNTVHPGIVAGWIDESLDWLGDHVSDAYTDQKIMGSSTGPKRLKVQHINEQGVPSGVILCFWIIPALHLSPDGRRALLAADGEDKLPGKRLTRDGLRWTMFGQLQHSLKVPFAPDSEKGMTTYAKAWVTYDTHGPIPKVTGPSVSSILGIKTPSANKASSSNGARGDNSVDTIKPAEGSFTSGPQKADPTDAEPESKSKPP